MTIEKTNRRAASLTGCAAAVVVAALLSACSFDSGTQSASGGNSVPLAAAGGDAEDLKVVDATVTTAVTTTTTTNAPATTVPLPVDVDVQYWLEEGVLDSSEVQATAVAAVEQTIRAFPVLEPPGRSLGVVFSDFDLLSEKLGPQIAQRFTDTHETAGRLVVLVLPGDSFFVVQAENSRTFVEDGAIPVRH